MKKSHMRTQDGRRCHLTSVTDFLILSTLYVISPESTEGNNSYITH